MDDRSGQYVLLGGDGRYTPVDVSGPDHMAVLIDDDALAVAVTERMVEAGVPILDGTHGFPNDSTEDIDCPA